MNENKVEGAGEVTPVLKSLAVPLEDPGSIPSSHRVAHSSLILF